MAPSNTSYKQNKRCLQKFTSCRWILAFMLCLLRICQTALRQSIGMALVCMAERPHIDVTLDTAFGTENNYSGSFVLNRTSGGGLGIESNVIGLKVTSAVSADRRTEGNASVENQIGNREFVWDATFEGVVLSSYYYGYLLTPLLSCYIERFVGAKRLVAICVGAGALVNMLTPELTRLNRYALVALRVIAGTTNGMIDPAVQSLWAAWAPRSEVAYLTAVEYTGVSLGGIFTFLVSGLLCQIPADNGWPLVFYFYGALSGIWVCLWLALVYNKPKQHPRISPEELTYISAETQSDQTKRNKVHPPWLKMLTSSAVWAIIVASVSFMWVYSWILCYLPMYMQDVLHYNISQNAVLSSLPFVGKFISGLLCGYLADRLLRTKMTVSCNRKLFQTIGCFGCTIFTVAITFLDSSSRDLTVTMLILAVAAQNITTVAYRISPLDIAPRYASCILALANTIAVAVSLSAPLVTSTIVYSNTLEQWHIMFYIVAALSVTGGFVFLLLGKADLQDWARPVGDDNEDKSAHGNNDLEYFVSKDSEIINNDKQDSLAFGTNNIDKTFLPKSASLTKSENSDLQM